MSDSIRLEKRGIPTVTLVHDRLEVPARLNAKNFGLSDVKIVIIPEPQPGESSSALVERVDILWQYILDALLKAN